SGEYENIGRLLGTLEQGPDQWMSEADEYAARMAGFDNVEDYRAYMQSKMPGSAEDYRAQAYTDEERAALAKQGRMATSAMRDEQMKQFEAMTGATGSWVRGMTEYDEYNQQIADTRLQRDLAIMGEEFARAMQMQESDAQQYNAMVSAGQMSVGDYLNRRQAGITQALDGFYQQAELKLQEYGTQIEGVLRQAEMIQKTALLEMGIDSHIIDYMSEQFELAMAPFYAELEALGIQLAEDSQNADNIMGGLGIFGMILGLIPTVICTELHHQGLIDDELFVADVAFSRNVNSLVLYGYRWWAYPLAYKMRYSPRLTKAVAFFALPWAKEMAHRVGVRKRGHLGGKLLLWFGVPLCYILGWIRREL
ncbi:MAG TPA: hypothetical protein VFI02_13595, partial [Armatimonadota bacterium]|nr:hypothetical protein [Armatimonadota bacterium]